MGEVWAVGGATHRAVRRASSVRRAGLRPAALGGLAMLVVLSTALDHGGYDGSSWPALGVALAAAAGISALANGARRPLPAALLAIGACGLLTAWIALSALWAPAAADTGFEARRALLYAVALTSFVVILSVGGARWVLTGLAAGAGCVAIVALVMRVRTGAPADPLFGDLLEKPIGYPNALGVLAAIGCVTALGVASTDTPAVVRRMLPGLASLLVLVLGLTEGRGAALALLAGVGALAALTASSARRRVASAASVALAAGGAGWALQAAAGGGRLAIALTAFGVVAAGTALSAAPVRVRRGVVAGACLLAVAGLVAVVVRDASIGTSSFRTAYWSAASAEFSEHPVRGSGAGSFYLTWREHGSSETLVRDGHSLYVEALSELGIVGLALVVTLVGAPLAAAWRRRGDRVAATAAAGFVVFAVHAGLDWDWELPAVTLAGLACAAAVLAHPPVESRSTQTTDERKGGRG